jgi:hypothetical protein
MNWFDILILYVYQLISGFKRHQYVFLIQYIQFPNFEPNQQHQTYQVVFHIYPINGAGFFSYIHYFVLTCLWFLKIGFTTTCAISAYHHWSFELEPRSSRCELDTTLCDKVYQWLAAVRWFSPGTPVSSTNKTDRHDITEILLKVPINTINKQKNISELFLLLISCSKQEFITRWPLKLSAKRWIEHVLWFFKHDVYSLAGM